MLSWSKLFHSLYQVVCSHSKYIEKICLLSQSVGAHFSTPYIKLFSDSKSITVVINTDIK